MDITTTKIYWPNWWIVNPETTAAPYAKIENVGPTTVNDAPVVFEIMTRLDSLVVYIDTVIIASLLPRDSVDVYLDNWTSGVHPTSYMAKVYTILDGDIDTGNDTFKTYFTACNRHLESGWGTPTLDGSLDTLVEWGDAVKIDISETIGWMLMPNAPGSCILYTLNDSNNLYFGIDYKVDNSLEEGDRLFFCFDEDHNGEWNPDSSEGYYAFYYPDSLWYDLLEAPFWVVLNPPGFEVAAGLLGGRVLYEVKLPLGPAKTDLTTNPGEIMGFFCIAADMSESDYGGWYPQDFNPDDMSPEYMADLKLSPIVGVEEISVVQRPKFTLQVLGPNPVKGELQISFSIPESMPIKLSVYDIAGRLVVRLADKTFKPGVHKVSWNSKLANGVYFIRLDGGAKQFTKKIIFLK